MSAATFSGRNAHGNLRDGWLWQPGQSVSRPTGAASCVDISVGSVATPGTVSCSVEPRLSRNARSMEQRLSRSSLCTGSHDEDAIARAASLERAEPAPGSQMLDDGDDDDDDDEYED